MKKITWVIGVNKVAGNTVDDGTIHYNEPFLIYLDGSLLTKGVHYTFTPDFTETLGRLDFTLISGLSNTQILNLVIICSPLLG